MSLSLQDLQDITAICEAGSFRKAAARLGITQPTLSSRVALMERRLGAQLFERGRGRSQPSELALTVAAQASGLLGEVSGLVEQMQRIAEGARGLVRMGFGPVPAYSLLEAVIREVDRSLPGATLVARSGAADRLLDMLVNREIDLAVCAGGREFMRQELQFEVLRSDPIEAVVKRDHPLATQTGTSLSQVFSFPAAVPVLDRHYLPVVRDSIRAEPNQFPNAVFCSNYWLLHALVDSGGYVSLAPSFCFAQAVAEGRFMALPLQEGLVHEIWLYRNERSLPLPAVEKVIDIIRQRTRAL